MDQKEIDKLINIAQSSAPTKELTEVERWIIAIGLKPGKHIFNCMKLWYLYRAWSPEPISQMGFYLQMQPHFKKQHYYKRTYYLVDPSSFDFPLELEEKMKADNLKQRMDAAKKSNEKKRKQQEVVLNGISKEKM